MFALARTFALIGVDAQPVHVEVHIGTGLPSFAIVGLPDTAVRESRERVRSALINSDFKFPQERITVNLAPADVQKAGPGFDLAIAAGILAATGQLAKSALERFTFAGELALDGAIRQVPGALAMAEGTRAGARACNRITSPTPSSVTITPTPNPNPMASTRLRTGRAASERSASFTIIVWSPGRRRSRRRASGPSGGRAPRPRDRA